MTFWCLVLGLPLLACGTAALLSPAKAGEVAVRFQRSRPAAWALCAVSWFWTARELDTIGIEVFDRYLKAFPGELWILASVLALLTCAWMPDLLAVRGLSAVFMLFPASLFPAVRLCETDWRIAPVVVAYFCAILGMFGMFYPWRVRQAVVWLAQHGFLMRFCGLAMAGAGALLSILGAASAAGAIR